MSAREQRCDGIKRRGVSHAASHMIKRAGVMFYRERQHKQKMVSNKSLLAFKKETRKSSSDGW